MRLGYSTADVKWNESSIASTTARSGVPSEIRDPPTNMVCPGGNSTQRLVPAERSVSVRPPVPWQRTASRPRNVVRTALFPHEPMSWSTSNPGEMSAMTLNCEAPGMGGSPTSSCPAAIASSSALVQDTHLAVGDDVFQSGGYCSSKPSGLTYVSQLEVSTNDVGAAVALVSVGFGCGVILPLPPLEQATARSAAAMMPIRRNHAARLAYILGGKRYASTRRPAPASMRPMRAARRSSAFSADASASAEPGATAISRPPEVCAS